MLPVTIWLSQPDGRLGWSRVAFRSPRSAFAKAVQWKGLDNGGGAQLIIYGWLARGGRHPGLSTCFNLWTEDAAPASHSSPWLCVQPVCTHSFLTGLNWSGPQLVIQSQNGRSVGANTLTYIRPPCHLLQLFWALQAAQRHHRQPVTWELEGIFSLATRSYRPLFDNLASCIRIVPVAQWRKQEIREVTCPRLYSK